MGLEVLSTNLDKFRAGAEEFGQLLGEIKSLGVEAAGILSSLGFDLPGLKVTRTEDGGWIVNGEVFAGGERKWSGHNNAALLNRDLPNWFPFGELLIQDQASQRAKAQNKSDLARSLSVFDLSQTLCDWVDSKATDEQLATIAEGDGSIGLSASQPLAMNAPQLRAYWVGTLLVAALRAGGDAMAYNEVYQALFALWSEPENCVWVPGVGNAEERRKRGICVGVPVDPAYVSSDSFDQFGRLASPTAGDWLARARSILRYLATGETMASELGAGSFAAFEACARSGDEGCLAGFQSASPDFWAAIREPWRFGYKQDKKIQIVKNTFGKYLAWDFGGKPRGVSLSSVLSISLPSVIAIGTIAALYFYASSKKPGK